MSNTLSHQQLEALLDFLELNKDLAKGILRGTEGRAKSHKLWEEITSSLNSMGGCIKTVQQWQRIWCDRKYAAKKAAAAARLSAIGTGGGPSTSPTLTVTEQKVLSIMGTRFGCPQTTVRVPAFPEPMITINATTASTSTSRSCTIAHSPQETAALYQQQLIDILSSQVDLATAGEVYQRDYLKWKTRGRKEK